MAVCLSAGEWEGGIRPHHYRSTCPSHWPSQVLHTAPAEEALSDTSLARSLAWGNRSGRGTKNGIIGLLLLNSHFHNN